MLLEADNLAATLLLNNLINRSCVGTNDHLDGTKMCGFHIVPLTPATTDELQRLSGADPLVLPGRAFEPWTCSISGHTFYFASIIRPTLKANVTLDRIIYHDLNVSVYPHPHFPHPARPAKTPAKAADCLPTCSPKEYNGTYIL
jgi:hypothetical protein